MYNDTFLKHLAMQFVQEIFGVFINSRIFLVKNGSTLHVQGKWKFVIVCVSWFFHLSPNAGNMYSKSNHLYTRQDCCTTYFVHLPQWQER